MANIKTPLLSLGARGSLGKAVSFTKRRGQTIVEKKPVLPYFKTLPVQYQRWLYQDYAALWKQQTAAVKQQYASLGVKHHLTGFQYWMKYQLTNLPDIAAWWKLDNGLAVTTPDSSRNSNDATVIGAIPSTLAIAGAAYFDGLNDTLRITGSASLNVLDHFSLEIFFNALDNESSNYLFVRGVFNQSGILVYMPDTREIDFYTSQVAANQVTLTDHAAYSFGVLNHLIITLDVPDAHIYLNGVDITENHGVHIAPASTLADTYIASRVGVANWVKGTIDNVILYSRVLTQADITRHSLRRWPQ